MTSTNYAAGVATELLLDATGALAETLKAGATKIAGFSPTTVTSGTAPLHFYAGGVAPLVTTTGTDTTGIATVTWINELIIPCNATLTGISYLIGSVGGTDHVVVVLFDSSGAVVAHSALDSSVTVGTTATMQRVPFTATYTALGPAKYYVGISTSGTTAKIRTQAFGDNDTGQITGGTFNTLVALTPPSTFTASQGPICMAY